MAKTKKKAAPEPSPSEVPLYTPWDVARYLRIPLWAVAALSGRGHPWLEPEFYFHHLWRGVPHSMTFEDDLLPLLGHPGDGARIPFRRFADLFVRAGVLQALAEWPRIAGAQADRWEGLHRLVLRGLEDTHPDPVPFDEASAEDRAGRMSAPFLGQLDERQAALIRKHLTIRLDRVEVEGGTPVRLFPLTRDPGETSPRVAVIDPRVRFGRPTLAGRGLPTDVLFERYQAGDSPAELAADYGIPVGEVDEAIRYESRPPAPLFPFYRW